MNLDLGNIKIYLGENTLISLYEYNYLLSTPSSVDKPPDLIERVTNGIPTNGIPEIFRTLSQSFALPPPAIGTHFFPLS
jgi:hypothetical protein